MSTNNPWGVIPSEGGAGLILCRRNTIETLKLKPQAQLDLTKTTQPLGDNVRRFSMQHTTMQQRTTTKEEVAHSH